MTRKKFIKQLGAFGLSRNSSGEMAYIARLRGWTYDYAMEHFKRLYEETCRQYLAAIGKPAGTSIPLWLSPYAGLCAVVGGKPVLGVDLSNGEDFTCITPAYVKDDKTVSLGCTCHVPGGGA